MDTLLTIFIGPSRPRLPGKNRMSAEPHGGDALMRLGRICGRIAPTTVDDGHGGGASFGAVEGDIDLFD